jgi:hypothetical protein
MPRRTQGIEDYEQRQTSRVGQQYFVFGINSLLTAHNRVGHGRFQSFIA